MSANLEPAEAQPLSDDVLHDVIVLDVPPEKNELEFHVPTPTLYAIWHGGAFLRHNPGQPLLSYPVSLTDEQRTSVCNQTLADMINTSLVGSSDVASLPSFHCTSPGATNTCESAESAFIETFTELERGDEFCASVVIEGGVPVLLRKIMGVKTCLTLCEINIDGVQYPAGSITSVDINTGAVDFAKQDGRVRPYSAFDISGVESLGFQRLSHFALPSQEREKIRHKLNRDLEGQMQETRLFRAFNIDDAASTVAKILKKDKVL